MRIASGVTDQYIYFVAVDSADFTSRETGLSSFTVYRSRNGGAAAAMTTPTINETDSTNMPGVYELLLDEDMTIDSGDEEQEMVFHITHAGMAPVTRAITLFRPKITAGYTLGIGSDGDLLEVNALTGHTVQTGDSYTYLGTNLGALGANATEVGGDGDHLTEAGGTGDQLTALATAAALSTMQGNVTDILADTNELQTDDVPGLIGALNDLDAAGIRTAVGLASANLDTQIGTLATSAALSTHDGKLDTVDGIVDDIVADTNELQTDDVPGLIAALNDLSEAEVNAQVLDVLNTDTFSQPGQEAPAATQTLVKMLAYLYKAWRNKSDQDSTTYQLYNDDASTVDQKAAVSESGGTVTKNEVATGP